ncbi:MAG: tetratricopeptide repeat protein [Acidobacteriaceae bacterium]
MFLLLLMPGHAGAQTTGATASADQAAQVKALYDAGRWEDVVQAVPESPQEPADLELDRGLALAQLGRFDEAERTLEAGHAGHPRDARFLEEMAGIAYRDKRFSRAKKELRRALALQPNDAYASNFLASIYFLEGNLEAALKYWNRVGKPKLNDLTFDPQPKLDPLILDRAFKFSPGAMWTREQFLTTQAELLGLDLFPHTFYELQAQRDGAFKLVWRASQGPNWHDMRWQTAATMLRGLPYQSVYPELYNLNNKGLNWRSFVRWDDEKRWLSTGVAWPLEENPKQRVRLYFVGRNENWNISNTLLPAAPPSAAGMNMRRAIVGAEVASIENWRWQWNVDGEYSYRDFRSLVGIPAQATEFFTNSSGVDLRAGIQRSLVRFPERRFSLDAGVTGEAGKFFANPLGKYGQLQGSLAAHWLPRAQGDDYETSTMLRAGRTFGQVPFDDFFMLGFDRDNQLWMRGHNGLLNGQKGNAPLGRNYVLSNSDSEKVLFHDAFVQVQVGPFLDTGDIYDASEYFGSPKWLTDTGLQAKVKLLGSFEFVLGYGKDLRSGANTFYSTVSR